MKFFDIKNNYYLWGMAIRLLNRIPLFLLTTVGVALLFILTLMPGDQAPELPPFPYADKVAHLLMFGLVSLAAMWDMGRYSGRISTAVYVLTALVVTALGAMIELVQSYMGVGRSGDWIDLVADAAGAFLLPLLFMPLLCRMIRLYACDVEIGAPPDNQMLALIKPLYMDSFPEEERRPWPELTALLQSENPLIRLVLIRSRSRLAGFMTLWNLGEAVYIEHFAIDPALRGRGIGGRALREVVGATDKPIVLEAEPAATSLQARQRIEFYQRNGFIAFADYPYIQPAYAQGLPEVELTLMATSADLDLPCITSALHQRVYGKKG